MQNNAQDVNQPSQNNNSEYKDQFNEFLNKAQKSYFQGSSQKLEQSSKIEFDIKKKDQHCTAIAFHPQKNYFVAAVGLKLYFYHILYGQSSDYTEEMSMNLDLPKLTNNSKLLIEQEEMVGQNKISTKISTIQFTPSHQDQHYLLVGTQNGCLIIIIYNYNRLKRIQYEEKLKDLETNPDLNRETLRQKVLEDINKIQIQAENLQGLGAKVQLKKLHKKQISCIQSYTIKNNLVEVLISSYDHTISCFPNQNIVEEEDLKDLYILQDPKEAVFWISVSEIDPNEKGYQTQNLVSSGFDNFIYVWLRKADDKWHFRSKYKRNELGSRISYFGSQFVVQQVFQKDYINILMNLGKESSNKDVGENINTDNVRRIQFHDEYKPNQVIFDNDKFPLLFNQNKYLMLIKYGEKIYALKCKSNTTGRNQNWSDIFKKKYVDQYQFSLIEKFNIRCSLKCTLGALSADGEYLVIYDIFDKKLKVFKVE
ncbi:unnamed protein product [Paramecium sonneborni]|uniref:WD40-repeat-containing domain n=1 Tax=Paramecium sonneborni TaxID=65129 RepID=A0A8S1MK95_9CILI|nr:unnamed protein product [Paramecium sonneborni]